MTYLVTAIGSLSAEAVIASLRQFSQSRIIGANSFPREWTTTSALVDEFHRAPPATEANYVDSLLAICRSENVSHVVPLTDVEIDVLTCHRNDFSSRGITLCIPSHESVHICRDKWLVYETFKDSPLVRPIPTWKLEDNATHSVPVPLIAKPRTGRSSEGLSRLTTVADLQHCRQKYANSNYILQPLMEGNVCVVDIVRQKRTGRWASMARQELIRTPNGAGLTVRMMDDAVLNDAAYRIADELDINGYINIEFLVHAGQPLLMDINPRFSAGLAFSKLSGYDMAANHFRCFSGQDIDEAIHPLPSIHARHYAEVTMLASDDKSP